MPKIIYFHRLSHSAKGCNAPNLKRVKSSTIVTVSRVRCRGVCIPCSEFGSSRLPRARRTRQRRTCARPWRGREADTDHCHDYLHGTAGIPPAHLQEHSPPQLLNGGQAVADNGEYAGRLLRVLLWRCVYLGRYWRGKRALVSMRHALGVYARIKLSSSTDDT